MSTQVFSKEAIQFGEVVTLETIICCTCGIPFAVPSNYKRVLHETKESFYCPNGHSQYYAESTAERLKKELEKKEEDYQWKLNNMRSVIQSKNETINAIIRQKASIKGQMTKLKKRVSNGVCPCCNRTFSNIANHIKTKHPEYGGEH